MSETEPHNHTGVPAGADAAICVEIVYAEPGRAWQRRLQLPAGANAAQALQACQFIGEFPEYAHNAPPMGVYGQVCSADRILVDGDRLEIYRPLTYDPMESRRRRAIHRRAFMTKPNNRPKRRKARLAAAPQEAENVAHTTK